MGGACGSHGGGEKCIQHFGGKPDGRRPLGRPRRRWEDNIRMDFGEVGFGNVDWIGFIWLQGQVAGSCEHGNEPSGSIK
jgi:hypothetical protein